MGYVANADVANGGSISLFETDGYWTFAYFTDILRADIDCNLVLESKAISGSGGINLPDHVLQLAADIGATWRYVDGATLSVRAMPGFYADLEELSSDGFSVPFSLVYSEPFTPTLSGVIGAQVRPGFDLVLMPHVGVVWSLSDRVQLRCCHTAALA